ncbi:hypothetical protein QMZ30_11890 [Pantoea sp. EA-12]|uniref:hypothetical protein n=1 Tax=Pantoea sp. EA-12 TaxID=3043303 RepID=UPI0024B52659|nr:hypothetical protein [Pantoea sp. EA-12]MDI9221600.1 hypothetical protein [Pantoea sp. EA-12]
MARLKAASTISNSEAHIEMLQCYLRESEIILRALEEQKTTARETLLYEKRLSAARREHLQLQNELSLATEKHSRLIPPKKVMQPA